MNIKANELRTGNILDYLIEDKLDDRQEWYEPSVVDWQDIKYFAEREAQNKGLPPNGPIREHYKPIPITEDWLLRLGFEEARKTKFRHIFDLEDNYSIGYDFTLVPGTIYEGMCGVRFFRRYIKCEFVHQLQNFVFVHTGKELQLKTPLK
jgi:hypothetical protein